MLSAGAASAQVTLYGRVDQSIAQQADAVKNTEMRPGSGNRLGFRGVEDLGGGLKAFFHFEHRFNADDGTANSTFWHGKSLVGLEFSFGRVWLGRDENPAYLQAQTVGDPFGTDTVATNANIVQGRIGNQRYANSVNYAYSASGLSAGVQIAESTVEDRPFSLGLGYRAGALHVGLGYENPSDGDDAWTSVFGSYNLGMVRLGAFFGTGTSATNQKHQSYLFSGVVPVGSSGNVLVSYGQLKNKTTSVIADKQFGIGYHHSLSKRTTLYADITNEKRDNMQADRKKTGWDFGIKHNF
jgi:predicted porin